MHIFILLLTIDDQFMSALCDFTAHLYLTLSVVCMLLSVLLVEVIVVPVAVRVPCHMTGSGDEKSVNNVDVFRLRVRKGESSHQC